VDKFVPTLQEVITRQGVLLKELEAQYIKDLQE